MPKGMGLNLACLISFLPFCGTWAQAVEGLVPGHSGQCLEPHQSPGLLALRVQLSAGALVQLWHQPCPHHPWEEAQGKGSHWGEAGLCGSGNSLEVWVGVVRARWPQLPHNLSWCM